MESHSTEGGILKAHRLALLQDHRVDSKAEGGEGVLEKKKAQKIMGEITQEQFDEYEKLASAYSIESNVNLAFNDFLRIDPDTMKSMMRKRNVQNKIEQDRLETIRKGAEEIMNAADEVLRNLDMAKQPLVASIDAECKKPKPDADRCRSLQEELEKINALIAEKISVKDQAVVKVQEAKDMEEQIAFVSKVSVEAEIEKDRSARDSYIKNYGKGPKPIQIQDWLDAAPWESENFTSTMRACTMIPAGLSRSEQEEYTRLWHRKEARDCHSHIVEILREGDMMNRKIEFKRYFEQFINHRSALKGDDGDDNYLQTIVVKIAMVPDSMD